MKKKKPKGAEDGKDAKDDEQGLVDGEQVEAEEVKKIFFQVIQHTFLVVVLKTVFTFKNLCPSIPDDFDLVRTEFRFQSFYY